jgi:hypothetical protein
MKEKIDATGLHIWEGKVEGYRGDDFLVTTEQNSATYATAKIKRAARKAGYPKARVTSVVMVGTIDA